MDKMQFDKLTEQGNLAPLVRAAQFAGVDRTLLYGFTVERNTWHVYLKGAEIYKVVYNHRDEILSYEGYQQWAADSLIPDKRVYPESTDEDFARLMQHHGISVPYTTFNPDRYEHVKDQLFHGLVPA